MDNIFVYIVVNPGEITMADFNFSRRIVVLYGLNVENFEKRHNLLRLKITPVMPFHFGGETMFTRLYDDISNTI